MISFNYYKIWVGHHVALFMVLNSHAKELHGDYFRHVNLHAALYIISDPARENKTRMRGLRRSGFIAYPA